MNKILFAPLLTMLVVSCRTITTSSELSLSSNVLSQSESSIVSQTTSSSSIVSSSNTTTTSSSTISSTNTSSYSSSSIEEPANTRKVPFTQLGSLVAQVVDAKAMGIVNSKDRTQLNGRRNAEAEEQNYMVKITESYNPNTEITEDQTIKVTFTRVTETITTELQTGTESFVATAKSLTIERLTELPGNIVITNTEGYEYRLLSENFVVQDWISSELDTIEFIFDEALTGITIESRSLNASISFIAYEGFTYAIKQGETVIYEDLLDNDEPDTNEALGNITLSGLIEGLSYDVTYEGYKVIETITQDEVEGQVDKLYVLYQYTFISFVPISINQRPKDQDLELDFDDVPLYDKQGYFSDSTRQSFVVDNNTGLIYKIENINIASLSGGCVTVKGNPFPFDIRLNKNKELEFFSLYQNSNIITYSCFKDSFGNKYIRNNIINFFDYSNMVTFYVFTADFQINQNNINYVLTEEKNVLKLHYDKQNVYIVRAERIIENTLLPLNVNDSYKVFSSLDPHVTNNVYKVDHGKIYWNKPSIHRIISTGYFDFVSNEIFNYGFYGDQNLFLSQYVEEYDLFLEWKSGTLYLFPNIFTILDQLKIMNGPNYDGESPNWGPWHGTLTNKNLENHIILENVFIQDNMFISETISGNKSYELIPEFIDNNWTIVPYIAGTYVAPPTTTITLQPINN